MKTHGQGAVLLLKLDILLFWVVISSGPCCAPLVKKSSCWYAVGKAVHGNIDFYLQGWEHACPTPHKHEVLGSVYGINVRRKKIPDTHTLVASRAKTDESHWSSSLAKLASPWPVRDSISEQGEQHPEGHRGWPLAYTHAAFTSLLPSIVPLSLYLQRMGGMGNTFRPWRPACFIIAMTRGESLAKELLFFVS